MKRMFKKTLFAGAFLLFLAFFVTSVYGISQEQPVKPTLADVDALITVKTVDNCKKAIEGYKLLLKDDPNNYEILYKLALAYCYIMDIKTHAFIEERDEFKPILKEYGETANNYADKAYKLMPKKKEVVAAALRAYAYHSASFGVVKAIFKGAAGHYKDLANQLNQLDDSFDQAMGHRFLGKLYFVAPWPVGSDSKALKSFKKAISIAPLALYSHYFAGLLYFEDKEYNLAAKEFAFVRDNPPTSSEDYFIEIYKKRANEYLSRIEKKKK